MTKMQGTTPYQGVILNESVLSVLLANSEPMRSSFVGSEVSVCPFIIVSIGLFVMDLAELLSLSLSLSFSCFVDAA